MGSWKPQNESESIKVNDEILRSVSHNGKGIWRGWRKWRFNRGKETIEEKCVRFHKQSKLLLWFEDWKAYV